MTDVNKVVFAPISNSSQTVTNPVDKKKLEKEKLDAEIQRQLVTKEDRNAAIEKAKQAYLDCGTVEGKKVLSEKEAQEMAQNYVRDQRYKENSDATEVFMDKKAYRAAQRERKEDRKELIKQYREEGLSRREARRKADAQLVENEYVKGRNTRKFVQNNKDLFYDEKGNFSSDKFKDTALKFANTNTGEDEAQNHYLSLKERRAVAEKYDVNAKVIKNIAKDSNLGYEKDLTPLYRTLYVAGTTVAGAGVGAAAGAALGATGLLATNITATAIANANATATAVVKDPVTGEILGSATETAQDHQVAVAEGKGGLSARSGAISGAVSGASTGLGLGLATMHFIKDKGGVENKIYTPGKCPEPVPVDTTPVVPTPEPEPEPEVCPLTPGQETTTRNVDMPVCEYKPKKGEYWYGIVSAKYDVKDHKEVMKMVHELKKQHGITDFSKNIQPKVMYLPDELLGHKVNCDADVKVKATKPQDFKPQSKYTGKYTNPQTQEQSTVYFYTDCHGNKSQNFTSAAERDAAMAQDQKAA